MISAMSVAQVEGPGAAAELAAEAVRAVNHLTLAPPARTSPGWEDVGDLYRVLGEVRVVIDRLPQALGQLAGHLDRSADGYGADAGTDEEPAAVVAAAVLELEDAQVVLRQAGGHLNAAQSAVAHLYS